MIPIYQEKCFSHAYLHKLKAKLFSQSTYSRHSKHKQHFPKLNLGKSNTAKQFKISI